MHDCSCLQCPGQQVRTDVKLRDTKLYALAIADALVPNTV